MTGCGNQSSDLPGLCLLFIALLFLLTERDPSLPLLLFFCLNVSHVLTLSFRQPTVLYHFPILSVLPQNPLLSASQNKYSTPLEDHSS